ncbi:MAG: LAGLIDADG family homing endonuclease [Candidatus Woesearchaeota archaeon]
MKPETQINKFKEFFELQYQEILLDKAAKGEEFLIVGFPELAIFDPQLADLLLEQPEDLIKAAEYAITKFDLGVDINIRVRFRDLPYSSNITISSVRSKHIEKFLEFKGIVRQKTDVRPQVTSARFECPSCGSILSVLQIDNKFKEPSSCTCGRKGKFNLMSKELVDAQKLVLEEAPEDLDGGEQPKRINIFLKNDLVSPISDKKTNPGSKITVTGILKEVPITLATGGKSTRFDLMIEANYVEPVQEEFSSLVLTDEQKQQILELSKDPKIYEHITSSIAPTIYGHDRIKEALVLQLFGGTKKSQSDGVTRRGDIHILLIGDPGSGKCVSGDTHILTESGAIKTIKELCEEKNISYLPSIQLNAKYGLSPVTRFWERTTNQLLELKTSSGRTIKLTKEHPLFTTNNGLIYSCLAERLKKNDWIAIPRKINVLGQLQTLKNNINNTTRNYKFSDLLTKDLAKILGYLCGDGHVKKSSTSAWIDFANIDKEVIKDYKTTFYNVFKENTTIRKKSQYVTSRPLFEYLQTNFPEITRNSTLKSIPLKIQESPDYILAEFLKALFECDSHVNLKKRQIEYTTSSKDLAEKVMISLLRFGIVARFKEKIKKYKNKNFSCFEIIISSSFTREYAQIGYTSTRKKTALNKIIGSKNTNIDVIPNLSQIFKTIRKELNLTQNEMGILRSSYCHYEQGNRNPSRKTLQKICNNLAKYDNPFVKILETIAHSDLFWDKIISVKEIKQEQTVYDFEIQNTHNFVANGIMVHNSQLLKRLNHVAPKSRFVSGKGASGAGLCVSPNSFLMTNPGGIETIEKVVEENLSVKEEYRPGVWKQDDITKVKVQSMNHNLKIQSKHPKSIWKLTSPEFMYKITLETGKQIELTANTKLFTEEKKWVKSSKLKEGEKIAVPRKTIEGNVSQLHFVDLIDSNPVIRDVEEVIEEYTQIIKNNEGIRKVSKKLKINENNLYHNWKKKEARGKIKLKDFKKLSEYLGVPWKHHVTKISLYNGKTFKIPSLIDTDFLYVAGLIAGDGDVRENNETISIRFSNSNTFLRKTFLDFLKKYELNYDIQKATNKRPKSIRFNNKIYGQILLKLGIPFSPKSNKLEMSNTLLHLNNELLSAYIAGLIDSDGSITKRNTKGSDIIEFFTSSEKLARQLQLVMLRYKIKSHLRIRPPQQGKIKQKFDRHILTIYGESIDHFKKHIPIKHPRKKMNLDLISNKKRKKEKFSDIRWEKIKKIEIIKSNYDYVYDLTVEDSHNFVVDGILVHNTASVVKDEFLKGWALEAGALVLANKGLVCIDELDKMTKEDASAMHEALEQQTITISKANIQATLRSETTVLAAANPKFGRFDPYEILAKQIELPSTLINRFDLIFPVKDIPNKERDEKLASFILQLHKGESDKKVLLDTDMIKRYVAYAKQKSYPKLTEAALTEIKDYFVSMRNSGNPEEKVQSIPISARQLEGLIRMSEASARTRLSDKVTRKDAKVAIDLLHHCLTLIGYDAETGKFDIDRITTGITASQRSNIAIIKDLISELEAQLGKMIPLEDLIREAEIKGVGEEKTNEIIEKLKRSGDLFSPRNGFISKI